MSSFCVFLLIARPPFHAYNVIMRFVLNNSAVAFLAGQMFLSVVFLYVAMETRLSDMESTMNTRFADVESTMNTRFAGVKAELAVMNIRLDKLEEDVAEIKETTERLEENQRTFFKNFDHMDQRLIKVDVLALQNKKEILLMKPQNADTRNQLADVQERLDYLDRLSRTRTYINPSEPYAPPTDG